jgi:hypothetical protein
MVSKTINVGSIPSSPAILEENMSNNKKVWVPGMAERTWIHVSSREENDAFRKRFPEYGAAQWDDSFKEGIFYCSLPQIVPCFSYSQLNNSLYKAKVIEFSERM